jgi:hypothetical protein
MLFVVVFLGDSLFFFGFLGFFWFPRSVSVFKNSMSHEVAPQVTKSYRGLLRSSSKRKSSYPLLRVDETIFLGGGFSVGSFVFLFFFVLFVFC